MLENSKKIIILHPILIALFPVFLIYSQNIHLILIQGLIFPALLILAVLIVLWIIIKTILKSTRKSALLSSLYTFLFFSYGHMYNILKLDSAHEYFIAIPVFLIITYTVIVVLVTYYLVKTNRKLDNTTRIINVMSIALVGFVLFNIGMYNLENSYIKDICQLRLNFEVLWCHRHTFLL